MMAVLESFETYVSGIPQDLAPWFDENLGGLTAYDGSTSNVTQGAKSWRWEGTPDFVSIQSNQLDLTGATEVSVDCTIAMIDASFGFIGLTCFNAATKETTQDFTLDGQTGLVTLICDLSGFSATSTIQITLEAYGASSAIDLYWDNLRDDLAGGGGTPVAVFYRHLQTQGIS